MNNCSLERSYAQCPGRDRFDSHQKVTIPISDLDVQPKAIIADTIDGKPLSGDASYWFVAKSRSKAMQKVTDVETVTVH